ncbi:hypothetical protein EC988_005104, partial [Linderina pennispora]
MEIDTDSSSPSSRKADQDQNSAGTGAINEPGDVTMPDALPVTESPIPRVGFTVQTTDE